MTLVMASYQLLLSGGWSSVLALALMFQPVWRPEQ